jgi:phenylacetate-CoA ligase
MYWNSSRECMERPELERHQLQKLKETVDRVYHGVKSYRQKMQQRGILPEDIDSIEDLSQLPFTDKQDLRDNYPNGLFAVPMDQIIRVHASSGTTGKPTVVGYTRRDISNWAEMVARCLFMGGCPIGFRGASILRLWTFYRGGWVFTTVLKDLVLW